MKKFFGRSIPEGFLHFQNNFPKGALNYALENSVLIVARDNETKKQLRLFGCRKEIQAGRDPGYDVEYRKQKGTRGMGLILSNPLNDRKEQKLTLTEMGRGLSGDTSVKNRIKKVDRLESNEHLYEEISSLYFGFLIFMFF